jgi:hypothetical protein
MSNKKFICTYFDINYLPRGLALYYSIKKFHSDFDFFVLAFDDLAYDYLNNLKEENIKLISYREYDQYFQTSSDKYIDKKQYFFSSTPNLCVYLMTKFESIDILLYLDADVYLFSALDPLYNEFGSSSIGFCTHRYHPIFNCFVNHYGKFNVGVNLFRNSETGNKCLIEWKNDCDSWYPEKPGYPLSFFSDQIFLDSWLEKYDGVKIIENIGVNVCYWNAANYKFSKFKDVYFVNDLPLIIYHFSSLRKESDNVWNTNSVFGLVSVKNVLKEIYINYINHIESFGLGNRKYEKIDIGFNLKKKIFHYFFKYIFNEKVTI